jgi:uncharacterized protein (TIGR03663 family)
MKAEQARRHPTYLAGGCSGGEGFPVRWELALYAGLVLVAAALHLWGLGARALHHDESLHALYSWYLYMGKGYRHNPMMHGPFQFHFTALIYFLLGASDYTARLLPALFGTALVGLPWFLRRHLGRAGALATAALLTISPVFLYYGRFARNDIYAVVWTLLGFILIWRYLERRQTRELYLLAIVLSLAFATKETAFITALIFGSFLFFLWVAEPLIRRLSKASLPMARNSGQLLVVMLTLLAPLGVGILKAVERLPAAVNLAGLGSPLRVSEEIYAVAFLMVLVASVVAGIWWDKRLWPMLAALFWGTYVLLFTTFLSNMSGFGTGVVGSLSYWIEQQGVRRGNQPGYYYFLLLGIYEFLPVIVGTVAAVYYLLRRSLFTTFLIYWAAASLVLYGLAGEKMPWLSLHLVLPFILLGGSLLGKFLAGIPWLRMGASFYLAILLPILLGGFIAILLLGRRGLSLAAPMARAETLAAVLITILFLLVLVFLWRSLGLAWGLRALGVSVLVVFLLLTVRTSLRASFQNGDIPVELLVYTQTSPEVPLIYRQIEQASLWKTGGKALTISVDGTSGFSWPWAWYLRDYKNVGYPSLVKPASPLTSDVIIVHASNVERVKPLLRGYDQGKRYRHRWWFPEIYRGLTPQKVWASLGDGKEWRKWLGYFLNRELDKPLGSEDGYVFFRRDLPLRP